MSEYRALRERYSLLELCRTPDLATEVTLQPVRRIEVDAAILFSDLLLPLEPMGIRFDFVRGEGPAIENPIQSADDIARLRRFEPREALAHVLQAIRQVQRELGGRVPLIGFAGAPFTLASYAIEGGHSNNFAKTKALMYGAPDAWHRLCALLADVVRRLPGRADRGGRRRGPGLRLVGRRAERARLPRVRPAPHAADLRGARRPRACRRFTSASAPARSSADLRDAGGDVIGADWRTPLDEAWETDRRRPRHSGQPRSRRSCSVRSTASSPRPTMSSTARRAARATSSTSATASCRPRRSSTCRRSRSHVHRQIRLTVSQSDAPEP